MIAIMSTLTRLKLLNFGVKKENNITTLHFPQKWKRQCKNNTIYAYDQNNNLRIKFIIKDDNIVKISILRRYTSKIIKSFQNCSLIGIYDRQNQRFAMTKYIKNDNIEKRMNKIIQRYFPMNDTIADCWTNF